MRDGWGMVKREKLRKNIIPSCFVIILLPYSTEILNSIQLNSVSFLGQILGRPIKMQVRVIEIVTYMYR